MYEFACVVFVNVAVCVACESVVVKTSKTKIMSKPRCLIVRNASAESRKFCVCC